MMHWFKDLFSFFFWKWKVTNTCINFFLTALVPFLILSFEPVVVISNIFFYSNVTCIASMNKSHYLVSQEVYTVFLLYLITIFLNELFYNAPPYLYFLCLRDPYQKFTYRIHSSSTFLLHICQHWHYITFVYSHFQFSTSFHHLNLKQTTPCMYATDANN